jgi:hypothetical protein
VHIVRSFGLVVVLGGFDGTCVYVFRHVLCNKTYLSIILFFSGEVVGWCCLGLVGRFIVFI